MPWPSVLTYEKGGGAESRIAGLSSRLPPLFHSRSASSIALLCPTIRSDGFRIHETSITASDISPESGSPIV